MMKCFRWVFCFEDYSMEPGATRKLPWVDRKCFSNSLNVMAGNLRRFMNVRMQGQQRLSFFNKRFDGVTSY